MNRDIHIVVWEGLDAKSTECLSWQDSDNGTIISSHLTGVSGDVPFAVHFLLQVDRDWNTRQVLVNDLLNTRNNIQLNGDGKGKWYHGQDPLPLGDGCVDVDLSLTPFTNTLPIRRLSWENGARHTIQVIYIVLPELTISRAEQYYTCIDSQTFRFETGEHFSATLPLDENKLVVDYPGIAKRIFPVNKNVYGRI